MGMGASSAEEIVSSHFISRTKACFSFFFPRRDYLPNDEKKGGGFFDERTNRVEKIRLLEVFPSSLLPPFFCYLIQLSPPTISEFFSLSPILGEEGGFIYMASRFRKREKEGRGESKYENV